MAIQSNFPAIRPSLLLDFANSKRLDPRITFTRASTARYYDGSTVAKAEENLLQHSQAFENAYWTKTTTDITADSTTAPDGTSTADTFAHTSSSGSQIVRAPSPAFNSTQYTFSVFLKYSACQWVRLSPGNGVDVWFDVQNGVVGTASGGTGSIVNAGGGWYRCIVVASPASGNIAIANVTADNSSTRSTDANFIWGAQLEQRSAVTAYTATTTAPITNYVPVLQTAAAGVPRFDHNPTTGESLGLLIEEARTNSLQRSEEFDNAYWTKTEASVQANVIVAPDGTLTGDKLVESANNAVHFIARDVSVTGTYTSSIYVKAGERYRFQLRNKNSGSATATTATVDLLAQTITASAAGGAFGQAATLTAVGNGWYRVTITGNTGGSMGVVLELQNNSGATTYTGDGYSGLYIWGAQCESASSFATSYIPTVAASATRQADAASMTGTNFSSWYDAAEGTVYAEAQAPVWSTASAAPAVVSINDGSASNRMYLGRSASTTRPFFNVATSGATQADVTTSLTSWAGGATMRLAGVYKVNDFALSIDGGAAGTDTAGTVPVVNQMLIGLRTTGDGAVWNSAIRKLAYYPLRLTNAQLQAITG